jgi:SRSO17 transposase
VAVFAVLTDSARHTPVDMRLYLPQRWIDDPLRCDLAEIPTEARTMRSKTDLAREMVRAARGMRFGWVGVDGGYGKDPAFLRALDDMGEIFSPMFMARSGSGASRRGCSFPGRKPQEVRQAGDKPA